MLPRTVTLELLRHGPSNDQLLSPLTAYLALSGNYDAETVHVGFEHVQLLRRMRGLRYQDGRAAEVSALEEASAEVSRLVASIRSLTAEIPSVPRGHHDVIHLRLVLSASELALLPFELIRSPAGFPGHGQWLSLQTAAPIALTREVRRVSATTIRWPNRPRILVVAARPPGVAAVPLRAHLLALRWALDPWLYTGSGEELARHVTVLARASIAAVRDECARAAGRGAPYTHVHVLAHGVPDEAILDGVHGYGLAFHADGDPGRRSSESAARTSSDRLDVVSGTRLAAALRCHPAGPIGGELSGPAVVTVASCDSANVGSVIAPGASIAHQLHESGVPLVLASQFPLSVRGSAIMAEVVYSRLLRGEDPARARARSAADAARHLPRHARLGERRGVRGAARGHRRAGEARPGPARARGGERGDHAPRLRRAHAARAGARGDRRSAPGHGLAPEHLAGRGRAGRAGRAGAHARRARGREQARGARALPGRAVADPRAIRRGRPRGERCAGRRGGEPAFLGRGRAVRLPAAQPARRGGGRARRHAARHDAAEARVLHDGAATGRDGGAPQTPGPAGPKPQGSCAAHRGLARRRSGRRAPLDGGRAAQLPSRSSAAAAATRGRWCSTWRSPTPSSPPIASSPRATASRRSAASRASGRRRTCSPTTTCAARTAARRFWAHGSLVELYVLAQLLPATHWARQEAEARAHRHLDALLQSPNDSTGTRCGGSCCATRTGGGRAGRILAALPRALGEKMAEMGVGNTHVEEG